MKKTLIKVFFVICLGVSFCIYGLNLKSKIYAQNVQIPLLNYKTTIKLDDFNFNQDTIYENKQNIYSQSLLEKSKIKYRISNKNSNKICVENGKLLFKGEEVESDFINFETQTNYDIYNKKYMVVKIFNNNEASLYDLSFCLDTINFIPYSQLKISNTSSVLGAENSNPYYEKQSGYYYIIIDILESSLCNEGSNLNTLSINYYGNGRIYIDEIFYADEIENLVLEEQNITTPTFSLTREQNEYFAYFTQEFDNAKFNQFSVTIDLMEFGKDLNSLILEIDDTKFYASSNTQNRKIFLTQNREISDINFEENQTQTITFDLFRMGVKKGRNFRFYANFLQTGVLNLYNVKFLNILTNSSLILKDNLLLNENLVENITLEKESKLLGEILFNNSNILSKNILAFDILGKNINLQNLSAQSGNQNLNLTVDKYSKLEDFETSFVYIELNSTNVLKIKNNGVQIYYNTQNACLLSIKNVILANATSVYQYVVENFKIYEDIDNVAPRVEIYNSPNFEIKNNNNLLVVDFDADANEDGDIESVEIILTNQDGINQYGDNQNKSFRVSEGVYELIVIATDINGNIGKSSTTIIVTKNTQNQNQNEQNKDNDNNEEVKKPINILLIVIIILIFIFATAGILVTIIILNKKKQIFGTISFRKRK